MDCENSSFCHSVVDKLAAKHECFNIFLEGAAVFSFTNYLVMTLSESGKGLQGQGRVGDEVKGSSFKGTTELRMCISIT